MSEETKPEEPEPEETGPERKPPESAEAPAAEEPAGTPAAEDSESDETPATESLNPDPAEETPADSPTAENPSPAAEPPAGSGEPEELEPLPFPFPKQVESLADWTLGMCGSYCREHRGPGCAYTCPLGHNVCGRPAYDWKLDRWKKPTDLPVAEWPARELKGYCERLSLRDSRCEGCELKRRDMCSQVPCWWDLDGRENRAETEAKTQPPESQTEEDGGTDT